MSGTVSFPSPAFPLCLCDQLTPWELSSPFSISLVLPAGVSIAAPVAAPLWRKEEKSSLAGSGEDFANGMPGEGRLFPCRTKWNSANARPTQPCHGERGKTFSYATEEENCGIAFRPSFLSSIFFLRTCGQGNQQVGRRLTRRGVSIWSDHTAKRIYT